MKSPRYLLVLGAWLLLGQIACRTPETSSPVMPTPPIIPTEAAESIISTSTPPIVEPSNRLVVCMAQEPKTLFWYGRDTVFEDAVLLGIYENDLTTLSYDYQAVGLEKIPSFVTGDASTRVVPVDTGDEIVDADGNVVSLAVGSRIIDTDGISKVYDGSTLLMDQLVVDFTMKQRFWSDGQPVTAADSVYSFHLSAHPDSPGDKFLVDRTASYQATGNLQVRWTGLPGFNDSSFQNNFFHPLPRHTWLDLAISDLTTADASSRFPLGDGPFKIAQWNPGVSILLEPNPFYYRSPQNYPRLDSIEFRFIADTNKRLSELLAGNCHIITHDGLDAELIPFFIEAEAEQLLKTIISPDRFGWEIIFGINSWGDYGDGTGRPDWFEDSRVRQAVAMCINKQEIANSLYYGYSSTANNYVPPQHPLAVTDTIDWPFDLTAANNLLDEVGYVDSDEDGIREDPITGADFHVSLVTGLGRREFQISQMLDGYLDACDIELLVERTSEISQQTSLDENKIFGRRFDLALLSSEATHIPACDRFASWQISGSPEEINQFTSEPFVGWEGINHSGWSNPTFDAICASALSAPAGTTEHRTNHQQAQRIFAEELPTLSLVLEPKITIVHPDVLNVSNDPTQESELWNLFEVEFSS